MDMFTKLPKLPPYLKGRVLFKPFFFFKIFLAVQSKGFNHITLVEACLYRDIAVKV